MESPINAAHKASILDAYERIKKYVRKTPLDYSPFISTDTDANVYLKLGKYIRIYRYICFIKMS